MKIKANDFKSRYTSKGYTQKTLAKKLGVTQAYISLCLQQGKIPDKYYEQLVEMGIYSTNIIQSDISFTNGNISKVPYFTDDIKKYKNDFWNTNEVKEYVCSPGLVADFCFSVFGRAMDPVVSPGDIVCVRKVNDFSHFNFGNPHFVITENFADIRYLKKGKRKGCFLLRAENSFYDDFEICEEKIKVVYTVIQIIKKRIL